MLLTRLLRPAGLALLLATSLVMAADAPAPVKVATRVPQPVIEAARGGQCVEDPAFMRRTHMDFLKHQRDDTMRSGIRGAKYSLKTCIECHASQTSNSVTATPTNFCVSCHTYAAVKIDCFECHATQPQKNSSLPPAHPVPVASSIQPGQQQVKP
jgi:hypothetical protein